MLSTCHDFKYENTLLFLHISPELPEFPPNMLQLLSLPSFKLFKQKPHLLRCLHPKFNHYNLSSLNIYSKIQALLSRMVRAIHIWNTIAQSLSTVFISISPPALRSHKVRVGHGSLTLLGLYPLVYKLLAPITMPSFPATVSSPPWSTVSLWN